MELWADVVPRRGAYFEGGEEFRIGRRSFNGRERNCLFRNRGGGKFDDAAYVWGCDAVEDGRGAAVADLDGDGAPDLIVNNHGQPTRLFRHAGIPGRAWCAVRLRGRWPRNAAAVGATVICEAEGLPGQALPITAGDGYLSQGPGEARFGLADKAAATVTVRWPGGRETRHAVGPGTWDIDEATAKAEKVTR